MFNGRVIMKKRGRPYGSREVSIDQLDKIIELTEEGHSCREIAEEVGVSKFTVFKYQSKFNLV